MKRPDWWGRRAGIDHYGDLVDSLGHEVIAEESFGDYQGDQAYILRGQDRRIGYLVIGYGSCSGCDAMQDAVPWCIGHDESACGCDWSGVVELRDSIAGDIRWGVAPEPRDPNRWYSYDGGLIDWLIAEYAKAVAS